jgi:hypothetical protein
LKNSELSGAAIGFIESIEGMNNPQLCLQFLISLPNDYLKFAPSSIETVSSHFETFARPSLLRLSPPIVSQIFEDSHFEVQSQEWLFSFLEEFCLQNGDSSFELFKNVQFSSLKKSSVKRFFSIFPIRLVSNGIWESLSNLSENSPLSGKDEKHSPPPPQLPNGISFEPNPSGSSGLFSHLRAQCDGQNPQNAGLVSVTASSVYSNDNGENVLDWGPPNGWCSLNDPNSWIDFNLLNKSFILKGLSIYTCYRQFARKWELLGSDGDEEWTKIYESNEDNRLNTPSSSVVNIEIPNSAPFKRFRIVAKGFQFGANDNHFCFHSIEFYGNLFLQE